MKTPAPNVSSKILGGQLQVMQEPEPRWMAGEPAGDEGKPSYFLIGRQGVTGNIRVLLDTTFRILFINGTECELIITMRGSTIVDSFKYEVDITIPHLIVATGAISEEGSLAARSLAFSDQTALKSRSDPLISWAVQTTTAGTDILVNG